MIKKLMGIWFLFLLLFPGICFAGDYSGNRSDFEFKISEFRCNEFGSCRVYGSLKNVGNLKGGPQLQCNVYDKNKNLIDSQNWWPNSITNIYPGEEIGVKMTVTDQAEKAVSVSCRIVDISVWK